MYMYIYTFIIDTKHLTKSVDQVHLKILLLLRSGISWLVGLIIK